MPFDKRSLILPDGARFEERLITAPGDIVLGNHVKVEFGLEAKGRIFGGENARVEGPVKTSLDLRLDHFSRIEGPAEVGGSAYLGEGTRIEGRLTVGGDLDVGDDVAITQGFEAKGWINIRSPVPIVIYLFLHLMELLRLGKSEEVEKILKELEASQERFQIHDGFLFVPDGTNLGLTQSHVKGNFRIGRGCRVLGNYLVEGDVNVGPGSQVFGALRAAGPVRVQAGAQVQGTIESTGAVTLGDECRVLGDVRAQTVDLHQGSLVDGRVVAPGGIRFTSRAQGEMAEKVERFSAGVRDDVVDLLG